MTRRRSVSSSKATPLRLGGSASVFSPVSLMIAQNVCSGASRFCSRRRARTASVATRGGPARAARVQNEPGCRDNRPAQRGGGVENVRCPPARLLGNLVGARLLAFLLVGLPRAPPVEEHTLLDEPVPDRDEVVVDALV